VLYCSSHAFIICFPRNVFQTSSINLEDLVNIKQPNQELSNLASLLFVLPVELSMTLTVHFYFISLYYMCYAIQQFSFNHHHLRLTSVFHAYTCVGHMRPLHLTRSIAHSRCKPNSSKSFFTHSSHVFLRLPLSFTPLLHYFNTSTR